MAAHAETSRLPAECFLQPESEDEESFVVLGSSLPPESLSIDSGKDAVETINTAVIQDSLKLTSSAIAQLNNSMQSLPSLPKVVEQELQVLPAHVNGTSTTNSSADLSPDEIQQKVETLIEENMKLKEMLHQNNLAMKKQYETLVAWLEDVMKVQQSHKEKFAEAKKYIENLKVENLKLTDALKTSQVAETKAKEELEMLKSQKPSETKENADYSLLKAGFDNLKELELDGAHKKIAQLEMQIEKLEQARPSSLTRQVEQLEIQLKAQAAAEVAKVKQETESLQKILLEEIKVLKQQLVEKHNNVVTKEAHDNVQEQLMAAQMHITKLELLRNEDKEIINAKEEAINKMEGLIKELTESNDTIAVLKAQLDLYKSDFDAERQVKESLKAEKEQIASDLQHLQRRNQQLLEEVEHLRRGDFVYVPRSGSSENTTASAPQDVSSTQYICPKCNFVFANYQALENHVYRCIEIDSLF